MPSRGAALTALAALLVVALAGCGDAPAPPPPPAAKAAPRPAAAPGAVPAAASAEQVAGESRGSLRCPAPPAPPRAAGEPVDDIVGVRPGMGWDEASQRVLCSHPLLVPAVDAANRFNLPAFGQPLRQGLWARHAQPRVPKTSKDHLREMQDAAIARGSNRAVRDVAPGESKWYLGAVGLPGQERITHVTREEWFPEGQWPTLAGVEQALVAKYGTPSRRSQAGGYLDLGWSYTPDGRRTDASCGLHPQPGAGVQLLPDCGVGVSAHVHGKADNPGLVQFIRVGAVDQARGYALIEQTERLLQQQESERRAKQVQEAGQKAKGPTL